VDGYAQDMGKKVNIEAGGETGSQHRWSCLSCGTLGPWTSQTVAVVAGEAHENQNCDEAHGEQHRDEDLDEILQNLTVLPSDSE
jgi:hypothetical protein